MAESLKESLVGKSVPAALFYPHYTRQDLIAVQQVQHDLGIAHWVVQPAGSLMPPVPAGVRADGSRTGVVLWKGRISLYKGASHPLATARTKAGYPVVPLSAYQATGGGGSPKEEPPASVCPGCHIELSATGECSFC